jgi:hypothetical protein
MAFLACPVREILYGGAKGGGKTDAIGPKVLKHVTMYGQWASVLILRESYPQLTEIIDRMKPLCLAAGGVYSKSEKTWTFPSGARVLFGHASDGCDPYWGKEYSLIVVDEVTRTLKTESDYLMLLGMPFKSAVSIRLNPSRSNCINSPLINSRPSSKTLSKDSINGCKQPE